jgi:hypothetical protein
MAGIRAGQDARMNGWKKAGLTLGSIILILGYGWLLWKGPWLIDGAHLRKRNLQPADGVVITGFRTMLVAVGAGLIAALGLFYTHRNHKLAVAQFRHTQDQFELAQEQFKLAQRQFEQAQNQFAYEQSKDRDAAERDREARVTEQYVTAVKLLGSSSHAERMGAIYSLQRIARDSQQYHEPIERLLASFVKERVVEMKKKSGDWVDIAREAASESDYGTDYEAARNALLAL